MINMIKAELYRLTRTKGFYLFWGAVLITYIITLIYKEEGGISFGAPLTADESVKMDIRMVCRNFNFYFYFIIPVFSLICAEFTDHTYKNTITSAISRRTYFWSKYLFTMCYSLAAFIVSNVLFYFANSIKNGSEYSSSFGTFMKAAAMQLPVMIAISAVFISVAFLVKKGAAFNAVTILGPVAYTTVALVLYGSESTKKAAEKLLTYEISSVILTLPTTDDSSFIAKCFIGSAVITAAATALSYLYFTRRELD